MGPKGLEALDPPWFVANEGSAEKAYDANEDFNFCLRARDAGFTVMCDPQVQAEHIGAHGATLDHTRAARVESWPSN